MKPTPQQNLAIINETTCSIELIKKGLGELQRISGANDFYHLPILLLASGFERLMKVILCLQYLHSNNRYPTLQDNIIHKSKKGHDLTILLRRILGICHNSGYSNRCPASAADVQFLGTDRRFQTLVKLLSDFAQGERYYNLNVVLGIKHNVDNPEQGWEEIETEITSEYPELKNKLGKANEIDKLYKEINKHLVIYFEKFARALARLPNLGNLGQQAKRLTGITSNFLLLKDSDLGKTKY